MLLCEVETGGHLLLSLDIAGVTVLQANDEMVH